MKMKPSTSQDLNIMPDIRAPKNLGKKAGTYGRNTQQGAKGWIIDSKNVSNHRR